MKVKEKKELKTKTEKDLIELLNEKRTKLASLRVEQSQSKLKNTREIYNMRKDVARLLTFLRERQFAQVVEKETEVKEEKGK